MRLSYKHAPTKQDLDTGRVKLAVSTETPDDSASDTKVATEVASEISSFSGHAVDCERAISNRL